MEFETIKLCFEKYINYMISIKKEINIEEHNLNTIKIEDIDRIIQISFMDYVISCGEKINQFSIPSTLYRHLNTLIRQYQQDMSTKKDRTIEKLTEHIFMVGKDNDKLTKSEPVEVPKTSTRWF